MKRGIQIGNYVLSELLNTGGMGQVWLAHREFEGGGQMAVAIKFPHAAGVLDPRIRDGLLDEARLQMRLQHTNIPRVVDMGVHEGLPYFVMDYIAGCSLAQFVARMRDVGMPLRFELIAHVAREIGYALRYAHGYHSQGEHLPVIHRDVAPKNVLISGQGGVYVVDFGVSEAAGIHTSRNFIKGTLLYMAPEHALGFPSPKSDGWGLGAILWEMIEGRQFRCEIEADDLRRAANEGRRGPLTRAGIPEALRFVTEGLLRVDERERLTLDEVINPLESTEFPPQRSSLAELLRRRFGPAVHRSGQTLHEFQMPEQLDRTIAAAKVVKDAGPRGLDSWSAEAFTVAGAPVVVPVGGTRPIPRAVALDDDDESAPRFVGDERPTGAPTRAEAKAGSPETEEGELAEPTEPDVLPGGGVRPQPTEHLPRVPGFGASPELAVVRTETIPPPSGARAKEEPRAARSSVPGPRMHGLTVRASEAAKPTAEPRKVAGPVHEEITSVWGIEPPNRADLPHDPAAPRPMPEPGAGKVQAAQGEVWVDHGEAPPSVPTLSPPEVAVPTPAPRASSEPMRMGPAPRARSGWAFALVAALWLAVGGGLVWAVWPGNPERETKPEAVVMAEPAVSVAAPEPEPVLVPEPEPKPKVQPEHVGSPAQAVLDSGSSAEPVMPATEPAPPPGAEPVMPTSASEPPLGDEPIEPAEPAPPMEPMTVSEPTEPTEPTSKSSKPKPARKPKAEPLPSVRVKIALMVGAPMDIEINGVQRSLDSRMTKATLAVVPGRARVRWRRPTGGWKSRKVVIEPGVDYVVRLEPSGPIFEAAKSKQP